MTYLPGLPKLVRARLDVAGVEAHLAWVAAEARAVEVRVKRARDARSMTASLTDAAQLLAAGDFIGAQIRYRLDGVCYCDTVMRKRDGFRLVRMRQATT
jgi:hypothetical protein